MIRKGKLTGWSGYLDSARYLAAFSSVAAALSATAALAGTLQKFDATSLPGDRVEIKLGFDSPPPPINGYTIKSPARIILDLPGTSSSVAKYNPLGFANARSVTVLESNDRTRLTVSLDKAVPYNTHTEGNHVYVVVGDQPDPATAPEPPVQMRGQSSQPQVKAEVTGQAPARVSKRVTAIDFERGENGEGNIIIGLSSRAVVMDLEEQAGKLRLSFANAKLPVSLRNRLDVNDFATPVRFVDARLEDGKAVVVIEPKGEYDYLAWQADDRMTISVKALTPDQSKKKSRQKQAYTGNTLSLNFQDIAVRDVLQILADFKDLNLVASDTVAGSVTLRLNSVPWDQALDIVLKSKGLGKRLENSVLVVAPAAELAAQERERLESQQQISELAPLYSELMQINYAGATEIAAVLQGGEGNRILSERGSVLVIERTNTLMVQETQKKLDEIRNLVEKVDIPIRQVQIEARIVSADTNFRKELGVKWGGAIQLSKNKRLGGQGSQWEVSDDGAGRSNGFTSADAGPVFGNNNLFTDLSVSGTGSSALAIGLLTDSALVNLEISALESDGGGEVISQPRVITSDKHTATIKSGREIPFQEASSSGATSTSFKEAVLSVEVTPQITPDGRVIMAIKVNNDSEGPPTASGIPTINTNEVETKVLIEDGQTVVLGGVFSKTRTRGVEKVPLLGDIPGIGRLFRRDTKRDERKETLIFITPKILTETVASR